MAERKAFYADAPRLLTSVAIGFGLSIWALTNTVIEPVAGRLSDRIGRLPVAAPGLFIILAGLLMLGRANTTISAYWGVALLSFGWSLVHAMADSISQDALPPFCVGWVRLSSICV
jgi:MFS family permease